MVHELFQNYPNPFNPITTIKFALPKQQHVKLEIFNILGQKVATVVDKSLKAGYHKLQYNGNRLASGLYFYRIKAGSFEKVRKMMLIK